MQENDHNTVSIIIPCYNVANYIIECLDSIRSQTFKFFDVICVNNNCTDNTVQVIQAYCVDRNFEIKIIHEQKQGAQFARNKGLSIARGSWIQFLDADDLLLPNKLEHQTKLISQEVGFIAGATFERNLEGNEHTEFPHENTIFGLIMGYRGCGSSCSNLWNTSVLKELGGFCEEQLYGQEYELMQRIFEHGYKIVKDNLPLTIIRKRHSGQMSQTNHSLRYQYYLKIIEKQILYFQRQSDWPLNHPLMIKILKSIIYRLTIQSVQFSGESARQYHSVFLPAFKDYVYYLPLKERIKLSLYNIFGYENVRKILNKRMQWSQ